MSVEINFKKISEIRRKLGYSQIQVAQAMGMSKCNWSKKENGLCGITLREALTLSKMFGLTVEEIFTYDNK